MRIYDIPDDTFESDEDDDDEDDEDDDEDDEESSDDDGMYLCTYDMNVPKVFTFNFKSKVVSSKLIHVIYTNLSAIQISVFHSDRLSTKFYVYF